MSVSAYRVCRRIYARLRRGMESVASAGDGILPDNRLSTWHRALRSQYWRTWSTCRARTIPPATSSWAANTIPDHVLILDHTRFSERGRSEKKLGHDRLETLGWELRIGSSTRPFGRRDVGEWNYLINPKHLDFRPNNCRSPGRIEASMRGYLNATRSTSISFPIRWHFLGMKVCVEKSLSQQWGRNCTAVRLNA